MTDRTPLVAAIDQGSSSTKGAVVTAEGRRLEEVSVRVGTVASGASVSHDAEELAATVESVLDRLLKRHRCEAIGLTCQRSTCLLWERESGTALTRAVSWQDTAQQSKVDSLAMHAETICETTGLRLSPHYAASKLSALIAELDRGRERANSGEVIAGTLDAFLMQRLTGRPATEPGLAGRTLLMDLDSADWSPELTALFGVPKAALPEIVASAGHHGSYRGVPVTALAGDQQAALLGHGGWSEGISAVHFGTGAFVLAGTGHRPIRHPGALSAVLVSTRERSGYQIETTINSAGSAVDWASRLGGQGLDEWKKRTIDPDRIPWVLPGFRGLGTPWWQPEATGAVAGLTLESDGSDLLGGTIFGVAMRVLDCVEILKRVVPVKTLRASGKLTRMEGLIGLLADAGQVTVEVSPDEETGLVGIARLAESGLKGDDRALGREPPAGSRREPNWSPGRAQSLRIRWRRFVESALELAPREEGEARRRGEPSGCPSR